MQKRELLTISALNAGDSLVGDNTLQLQSDPISSSEISIWQFLNVDCCYSQANKRELLADYALPVAVLSFSFIGSVVFDKVSLEQFDATEVDKQNITLKLDYKKS